jgi:ABC-type iron transport system FetAB permease component
VTETRSRFALTRRAAALVAVLLAYRNFFTPAHQLREQPEP